MAIQPVKLILAADSGSGKTGACAALCAADYSVRVMDLDNGSDILHSFVTDPESPYVKAKAGIGKNLASVVKISEPRKVQGGKLAASKAEAWGKATKLLEDWKDPAGPDLGSIATWGVQDVLVVDSFTRLGEAALRFIQAINGRLNQHPYQSDYGEGQTLLKNFLEIIFSPDVQCNVVLNCHVQSIESSDGVPRDFPLALGRALGPLMGTYVNSLLTISKSGNTRKIKTIPSGTLGVKNTAPFKVKPEYPLESGLADYFAAVRGQ